MKKFLPLSLFGIVLSSFTIFGESIIDFHHLFGRCSASNSYCSACSNCSACKNCAVNGGSCAVCYTPKVIRQPASRSSSTSTSYRSASKQRGEYKAFKPAQRIKSNAPSYIPPSRILTSQTAVDLSERPVSTSKISIENAVNVIDEQEELNKSVTDFDYKVDIPLDAEFIRVTVPVANLRTSANAKSQIKQKVKYGELLIKLEISGDWVKVQTLDSGFIGYVFTDLVQ